MIFRRKFHRYKKTFSACFAVALFFSAQGVFAQSAESISDFLVKADIQQNGIVSVEERITYDFGETPHHGIFRFIPFSYERNGSNYKLRFKIKEVVDENGVAQLYSESRSSGNIEIKIGSEDQTVTGVNTYIIRYDVARSINFFDDHDEWYWNVTGNEWDVAIERSSIDITAPAGSIKTDLLDCFSGEFGATEQKCIITPQDENRIIFSSSTSLFPYEGLTVVVGLEKGTIPEPSFFQNIGYFVTDNWGIGIIILVWAVLHLIWMKKGKDPKVNDPVIPQYEAPRGMHAGEVGTLWDEHAQTKDVSGALIDLAVRGYIKIKDLGSKNFQFTKLKDGTTGLVKFEKTLLEGIFESSTSVELKSLKNKFYKDLATVQSQMYESLVERLFYDKNPNTLRGVYYALGGLSFFGGFFAIGLENVPLIISIFLSGILFFIYGRIMPKKTIEGARARKEIEGFKWFLSVTETERLKFHNAPEKKPEQFEKLLPYAMVLGVEKQWAKQFEGMYLQPPSWYEGTSGTMFNALLFTNIMSGMSSNMNSAFASRPGGAGSGGSGFGGGGFSGGGFGGGGGGSW